ncbi:MAG TPA: Stf0 family sulfotransferase [Acidimicrobiales bacterium]|nr:Stf0 family sulfotransferase [Acidimicrobiales bacterium]
MDRAAATAFGILTPRTLMPRRFVIFSMPRSGSTLLTTLVNSHPLITCDGEVFNLDNQAAGPSRREHAPHAFLEARAAKARLQGAKVYGFKLMSYQMARYLSPDFLLELHQRGFQIIYLWRRDMLSQAISAEQAAASAWEVTTDASATFERTAVDPRRVIAGLERCEADLLLCRSQAARLPTIELTYEADLRSPDDRDRTMGRLLGALGVPPAPLTTALIATAPRDPLARVTNPDEIRDAVVAGGWGHLLKRDQ